MQDPSRSKLGKKIIQALVEIEQWAPDIKPFTGQFDGTTVEEVQRVVGDRDADYYVIESALETFAEAGMVSVDRLHNRFRISMLGWQRARYLDDGSKERADTAIAQQRAKSHHTELTQRLLDKLLGPRNVRKSVEREWSDVWNEHQQRIANGEPDGIAQSHEVFADAAQGAHQAEHQYQANRDHRARNVLLPRIAAVGSLIAFGFAGTGLAEAVQTAQLTEGTAVMLAYEGLGGLLLAPIAAQPLVKAVRSKVGVIRDRQVQRSLFRGLERELGPDFGKSFDSGMDFAAEQQQPRTELPPRPHNEPDKGIDGGKPGPSLDF